MKIEIWKLADVKPYEKNPRKNDKAIEKVAASIKEFGWRQPIVVDKDGVIVAGHTRWEAALHLGLTEVPVHVALDLTPEQARAYRLADNKTNEFSTWDDELLGGELAGLRDAGFDLGPIGFADYEIAKLTADFANPNAADPDEEVALPEVAVSRLGDIWICGDHRIRCGDSTKAEDVSKLLAGAKPFMMVTDPPYGVNYDPEWRHEHGRNESKRTGVVQNDDRVEWTEAYKLFPGFVAYIWHSGKFSAELGKNVTDAGFEIRAQIIWKKMALAIGRGHYHWQHEPAIYATRKGKSAKWCGDRTQSTIWEISNKVKNTDDAETTHGTQKPVECMARPIRNHGDKTDAVYDPFLGSGTTVIACEMLGRKCFGMELSPAYVDMDVTRWAKFTGKEPTLEGDGRTFNQIAAERLASV